MSALKKNTSPLKLDIAYSAFESDFFNLRVFRSLGSDLPDAETLRSFCLNENIDLLRLKIDITQEENINNTLYNTGFPFFYSHSVMTVFADYLHDELPAYKNENLAFEKYNRTKNKERFHDLVFNGMGDNPIGYYKTPLINEYISKENEAHCYADYYTQLYDSSQKEKLAFLMSKDGKDAGVFVFELEGNSTIHTSMAALLPQHRSSGLFHDMKVFRQHYCIENGITNAYAGFRINNFHTPNSLLKTGYKIVRAEHIFHLPLLLSKHPVR
ncbi:MAG: hypothetical protein SH857_04450 [Chitinophagales bacterium]|nr:hypothetical protein [Chitinophagales bacterium]